MKRIDGFEITAIDGSNNLIMRDIRNFSVSNARELSEVGLFSSNSSYKALSEYTFNFYSIDYLLPLQYIRIIVPDCFKINLKDMFVNKGFTNGTYSPDSV